MIKWATKYDSRLRGISACQMNYGVFGRRYRSIRMEARRVLELLSSRQSLESPGRPKSAIPTRYLEAYRDTVSRGDALVPPVIHVFTEILGNGEPVLVYSSGSGRPRVAVAMEHGETTVPVDLFVDVDATAQEGLDLENPAIYTINEYRDLARSTKLAAEIGSELEESARRLVS